MMRGVTARIFFDPENKLCISVSLGADLAEIVVPEHIAKAGEARQHEFFNMIVPEMIKGLYARRRKASRKLKHKAARNTCTHSTTLSQKSSERTLTLLPAK